MVSIKGMCSPGRRVFAPERISPASAEARLWTRLSLQILSDLLVHNQLEPVKLGPGRVLTSQRSACFS